MFLVLISSPDTFAHEHEVLGELLTRGVRSFHVRKPGWSAEAVASYIEKIPSSLRSKIVLHDHYELIEGLRLQGLHLPEGARKALSHEELRARYLQRKSSNFYVSTSFHRIADLTESSQNWWRMYSYVFLSPIFDSISKSGYRSAFSLSEVQSAVRHSREHVVALGGVDQEKIPIVKKTGFSGAGLLGAIWNDPDPVRRFALIREACK